MSVRCGIRVVRGPDGLFRFEQSTGETWSEADIPKTAPPPSDNEVYLIVGPEIPTMPRQGMTTEEKDACLRELHGRVGHNGEPYAVARIA